MELARAAGPQRCAPRLSSLFRSTLTKLTPAAGRFCGAAPCRPSAALFSAARTDRADGRMNQAAEADSDAVTQPASQGGAGKPSAQRAAEPNRSVDHSADE
eukprot:SAG31_NODE_18518_length_633_cov_0.898876_1_plen_100_part_10